MYCLHDKCPVVGYLQNFIFLTDCGNAVSVLLSVQYQQSKSNNVREEDSFMFTIFVLLN